MACSMTEGTGTISGAATGSQQPDPPGQVASGGHVRSGHGGHDLPYGAAGGALERADVDPRQRHRNSDNLGRTEVKRRKRQRLVHGVTAGPPGIGVDRHPGLQQRPDITLDGPRAHLYSDASSRALRRRGAQARSSSTSAYSRSVRFTS
jgi:hypothetical protein